MGIHCNIDTHHTYHVMNIGKFAAKGDDVAKRSRIVLLVLEVVFRVRRSAASFLARTALACPSSVVCSLHMVCSAHSR